MISGRRRSVDEVPSTFDAADSIQTNKDAINTVSSVRGELGAYQNRNIPAFQAPRPEMMCGALYLRPCGTEKRTGICNKWRKTEGGKIILDIRGDFRIIILKYFN